MTLDETADQLYALPPEDFTAARDEAARQAKAAGDADLAKQVKALRRPSVGAWLVNLLASREGELLEQLLSLGPALAQAQAQGQGEELRQLGAQRRELVTAVATRAVELGGRSVSAAVREEVASTLETALADPASADALRSGRLVRGLSYAGFGGVDLAGAVAGSGRTMPPRRAAKKDASRADDRSARIAEAEAVALAAAGRLDDVVRACEQAERARTAAEQQAEQAHHEVDRLQQALRGAEAAAHEADRQRKAAERDADGAVTAVRKAQRSADGARAELDRLRRG